VKAFLEDEGFQVSTANDGEDGWTQAQQLVPDVVITELFPFGRRALADEALALLAAARARRPRPAVLCSVRDILNPPSKPSRADEALERLGASYDAVLVHGDPAVAPLAASWPVDAALARRLVPTGYIADRPATALPVRGDGAGEIVVSGGGSAASLPLYAAALGAAASAPDGRRWRVLVGHGVDAAAFDSLVAKAPDHAIVERARRDFPAVLARAAVSVSQAGYNTVVDLACAGVRAVVVPFEDGREQEQRLRADCFSALGLLQVVTEAELSAESLAAAVDRAAAGPAPAGRIDLDGLAATATAIVHAADAAARRAAARGRFEVALAALHKAGQTLRVWWRDDDAVAPSPALNRLLAASQCDTPLRLDDAFVEALRATLRDASLDAAFKELVLTLPSESYVAENLAVVDPQRIHAAREAMRSQLATELRDDWAWAFEAHQVVGGYSPDPVSSGRRALANLALSMLCLDAVAQGDGIWPGRAYQRFKDASNMTDRIGALAALVNSHAELAAPALERFHALFKGEPLVIDKWFAMQATAPESEGRVFARAQQLLQHPDFSIRNPNRARSLIAALCMMNPAAFHRSDAAGYVFWADRVLELDAFNPQLAARMARIMDRWSRLAEPYRRAAREALSRVAAKPDLSSDVREIISRALLA
jgi:predicted glycosyltransferase